MAACTVILLWAASLAAPRSEVANVSYATRDRVYFDRGAAAGLDRSRAVTLERDGRVIGTCTIDHVSKSGASCAAAGGRAGDRGRFEVAAGPAPPERARSATVGPARIEPSEAETEQTRARLESAEYVLIEAAAMLRADPLLARKPDASVTLGHETWFVAGGNRGDFERERADVVLRDLPLGLWRLTADVDLTALLWSRRPEGARYRSARSAQLFVYETSISSRDPRSAMVGAIGRIRPWHAPGLSYVDGAQVGWRRAGSGFEAGVVAGGLPDALNLEPTTQRWLFNGYWSIIQGDSWLFGSDGRVGAAYTGRLGVVGELESSMVFRPGRAVALSAGARGIVDRDGAAIAGANAGIALEPIDTLSVTVDGRIREERYDIWSEDLPLAGADHVAASIEWRGLGPMYLGASGGFAKMRDIDRGRGYAGPELTIPDTPAGDVSFGYQEALGDLPGRTAWTQLILEPAETVRVFGRLAYLEDRVEGGALHDVGFFGHFDWRPFEQIGFGATLLGRLALMDTQGVLSPLGVTARVAVTGEL